MPGALVSDHSSSAGVQILSAVLADSGRVPLCARCDRRLPGPRAECERASPCDTDERARMPSASIAGRQPSGLHPLRLDRRVSSRCVQASGPTMRGQRPPSQPIRPAATAAFRVTCSIALMSLPGRSAATSPSLHPCRQSRNQALLATAGLTATTGSSLVPRQPPLWLIPGRASGPPACLQKLTVAANPNCNLAGQALWARAGALTAPGPDGSRARAVSRSPVPHARHQHPNRAVRQVRERAHGPSVPGPSVPKAQGSSVPKAHKPSLPQAHGARVVSSPPSHVHKQA